MNKVDEGKLISGKEALIAWYEDKTIQLMHVGHDADFKEFNEHAYGMGCFKCANYRFRLAPRTITINGIEVPAPFEPKEGDECFILDVESEDGFYRFSYGENSGFHKKLIQLGAWRTEEEIKQVVAALRQVFGGTV